MMKFDFDAKLKGANGVVVPVYCEVQPPQVGGQKSVIRLAVPAQYIVEEPPKNPCSLVGKGGGDFTVEMSGVHWRYFPTSSRGRLGLEAIELLHVERLTVLRSPMTAGREIRFHLAPLAYLRSESGCVFFGDRSGSADLFELNLPNLGATRFAAEWVTIYQRNAEIPGAKVLAGFSAIAGLPPNGPVDVDQVVAQFKSSIEVLSVLFRQAVSLHGWTYNDGHTVSTWIASLDPKVTPHAREDRGDFVAEPQVFVDCANGVVHAYGKLEKKRRSLVRHLSVAVNPHNHLRNSDHFLFMFAALERVIEFAWRHDVAPLSPTATTPKVIEYLERLQKDVMAEGEENAQEISKRLAGLINVVKRPSFQDKLEAFFSVYPQMRIYCSDLWPILGSEGARGLREIRNALAHGRSSFVSLNVVAVAEWHLAILLERVIFVLLDKSLPEGILPHSFLLRIGAKGWYDPDWWEPLRSEPDQPI